MNEYVNCKFRKIVAESRAEVTEETLRALGPLTIAELAEALETDVSGAHDRLCLVEARGNLRIERPDDQLHRTASYIAEDLFSLSKDEDAVGFDLPEDEGEELGQTSGMVYDAEELEQLVDVAVRWQVMQDANMFQDGGNVILVRPEVGTVVFSQRTVWVEEN